MAGNIPVSQVPNLKQAAFQQEMPTNLMAAEGQAMQGLGGVVRQSGQVLDQWHDKRQAHASAAAVAKAQLAMTQAESDLGVFMEKNPDSPEKWETERSRVMSDARLRVDQELDGAGGFFGDIGTAGVQSINTMFDKGEEVTRIKLGAQTQKRGIELKNADLLQYGKNLLANGDREGALKSWGSMTMPNEKKVALIESSINDGRYEELLGGIKTAPSIEVLEDLYGRLESKKDGAYLDFNEDIGAMPIEQRMKLLNVARNAIKRRKIKADKSVKDAVTAIGNDEDWSLSEDVTEEQRISVEQYAASTVNGFTADSDEYNDLEKEITGPQRWLDMGDKDQKWFDEQWQKINGGYYNEDGDWVQKGTQFNRKARMGLISAMVEAEADSIADDEEDVEGKFWDRSISPNERLVRTSLKNRIDVALTAIAGRGYTGSVAPEDYGRAYQKIVNQIRHDADAGLLDEGQGQKYLEKNLPALMLEHVKPLDKKRVREKMRGESKTSDVSVDVSAFTKGQRVEQAGVTYEFDGTNWNPVN